MEPTSPPAAPEPVAPAKPAVFGYERAAVDDFLAAAGRERERLEAEIEESRTRERKARAAIGMHRVMISMLLETQIELEEKRRAAEAEAAAILARTEEEASRLEATTARSAPDALSASFSRATSPSLTVIDLERAESIDEPLPPSHRAGAAPTDDADQYFEFLRGALADDQPLGPRPS